MTSDAAPIEGAVQLNSRDQLMYFLAVLRRRWIFLGAIGLIASAFAVQAPLVRRFHEALGQGHSIPAALLGTLPTIVGSAVVVVPVTAVLLLAYIALVVPFGVHRMGHGRRALTYRIDESGVRTRDALGAELVLPWSNIARMIFTKRILLIRLMPRGWRYAPLRAFSPQDRPRIRDLASRMIGSPDTAARGGA